MSGLKVPNPIGGRFGTDAIRTAILYRASVLTPAGAPITDAALIKPEDPAFGGELLLDRPPTVQPFTLVGGSEQFTVVVNHLESEGSTNDRCGDPDPIGGFRDDLRERQDQGILGLVDGLGTDNALLLGDFNSYEEEPIDTRGTSTGTGPSMTPPACACPSVPVSARATTTLRCR